MADRSLLRVENLTTQFEIPSKSFFKPPLMLTAVNNVSWQRVPTKAGQTAILNVNSEVRITPVTSPYKGLMTVSAPQRIAIAWRRCTPSKDD